ncbi:hypothetical protein ASPSYDRAFT_44192 [Aspergillus sydowii CBS 593.65]|uniref:Uncharacterized protein n=1 Tax=Aspergillus sydowii CBS 593.65 TaxID=1036612 RepID=A0A1L9TK40_9EURO|nr:uncharacterized protein ASPSYDRAFT_44192 [Aspergillus sydowii CBS 593.65]OJJ59799.1 hypothetical protein ASPSYDRAFT_44192 [Aspergillus sydowii CBS 593.65]
MSERAIGCHCGECNKLSQASPPRKLSDPSPPSSWSCQTLARVTGSPSFSLFPLPWNMQYAQL